MSDLLPNLDALVEQLTTGRRPADKDALALAEAARAAESEAELDAALAAVVSKWRKQ